QDFNQQIAEREAQIRVLEEEISKIETTYMQLLAKFAQDNQTRAPAAEGNMSLRSSRVDFVKQTSENLSRCSEDLIKKRKALEEQKDYYVNLKQQYTSVQELVDKTKAHLDDVNEEERTLAAKAYALTCRAQKRDALDSLAQLLTSQTDTPLCKRLLHKI